ncbi:hypothetical protein TNCT_467431 [Trichonephila clavata]|uniref:Uncharacterized protein n=1 Tax=Trichonephila clavata TaxID=2740835 RepID=A0A8X6LD63_TRICU|nr:hypothetical protein TNCT_467431 [Trichonephila clavata]
MYDRKNGTKLQNIPRAESRPATYGISVLDMPTIRPSANWTIDVSVVILSMNFKQLEYLSNFSRLTSLIMKGKENRDKTFSKNLSRQA